MTATTYDRIAAVPFSQSGAAGHAGVGRPACRRPSSVWGEDVRTRVGELRAELKRLDGPQQCDPRAAQASTWLDEAEEFVASARSHLGRFWFGHDVEAAQQKIHAAEVALIQLCPLASVKAKLSRVVPYGEQLLPEGNSCLAELREHAKRADISEERRESLAEDVRAVYDACRAQNRRLRSFRNLLLGAALALVILAIAVGVIHAAEPSAFFLGAPTTKMAKWDVFVIELLGLLSASLVGAVAIRQIRGTSTPYGVPMASLLLKLPTGALTAVTGLLLIRSGIVGPEVGMNGPHLAAYALGLGASQQTFTRLIDRQAQNVLNNVPSLDRDAAKDPD
jgi:hypothetical protein